jgi:hypothetical protein
MQALRSSETSVAFQRTAQRCIDGQRCEDLKSVLLRMKLDGRACVLRAICEAADTTLLHNGLAGELLHVLLT